MVLWRPAFFGIKPELVIKGGFIVWSAMGDSAASLMTCEPLLMRPQWGAFGRAKEALSLSFVSQAAADADVAGRLGLESRTVPVQGTRKLAKGHMLHNGACPEVSVDPETFEVRVDGALAACEPADDAAAGPALHAALRARGARAAARWT